eukprot:COSAG02_NODE_40620_length_403_cov_0.990132_1_plen_59_part_10
MGACGRGETKEVRQRLDQGADPNAVDSDSVPGLWRVASAGHTEVVGLLLEAGAHPDRTN